MMNAIKLVIFSFIASACFGFAFKIGKKYIVIAGLAGALTRIVLLTGIALTDNRLVYSLAAAVFAAAFAEIMANHLKMPSTVFLYPAIIPLIPGDLLFYACNDFLWADYASMAANACNCGLALIGICLGFVLVSTVAYYHRMYLRGQHLLEKAVEKVVPAKKEADDSTDK